MWAIPIFTFMISGKFAPTAVTGNYIGHIIPLSVRL